MRTCKGSTHVLHTHQPRREFPVETDKDVKAKNPKLVKMEEAILQVVIGNSDPRGKFASQMKNGRSHM